MRNSICYSIFIWLFKGGFEKKGGESLLMLEEEALKLFSFFEYVLKAFPIKENDRPLHESLMTL